MGAWEYEMESAGVLQEHTEGYTQRLSMRGSNVTACGGYLACVCVRVCVCVCVYMCVPVRRSTGVGPVSGCL